MLNPCVPRCIFDVLDTDDKLRFAASSAPISLVLAPKCQQLAASLADTKAIARAGSIILYKHFCRRHDIPTHNCRKLLLIAAEGGHSDLVDLLLASPPAEHECDVSAAVCGACYGGHEALLRHVLPRLSVSIPLCFACASGNVDFVRIILDHVASFRDFPNAASVCVRCAVLHKQVEILKLLLSRGVKVRPELIVELCAGPWLRSVGLQDPEPSADFGAGLRIAKLLTGGHGTHASLDEINGPQL